MSRIDPRDLADRLGVDIAHAERSGACTAHGLHDMACKPFELKDYPAVAGALAENTGDRSTDTMRIASACFDAGLTLAQARWAVRTRGDLAERLDEFAARTAPVDDLANCWHKLAPGLLAAPRRPQTVEAVGSQTLSCAPATNGQAHSATAPPSSTAPSSPLDGALATFRRWLHLDDPAPVLVTAATVAANRAEGDPVWTLLVGPPSSGKTEILSSLAGLDYVVPAATITEAALLSGTPRRDKAPGATGGLLRQIGEFGILLAKDFTSVLAQNRDTARQAMAALREVYDGSWDRPLGTDGGRVLRWNGKCGFVGGVTPSYDRYSVIVSTLGDRFLLLRLPAVDPAKQFRAALAQTAHEKRMRAELAEAMVGLIACADHDVLHAPLDAALVDWLGFLATFTARVRTAVERDGYSRELEVLPQPEGPARIVKAMRRLHGALAAVGADDATCRSVLARIAVDCAPAVRVPLVRLLLDRDEPIRTSDAAAAIGVVTKTASRLLEDLALLGIADRTKKTDADNSPDLWAASGWLREHWPGDQK